MTVVILSRADVLQLVMMKGSGLCSQSGKAEGVEKAAIADRPPRLVELDITLLSQILAVK